MTETIRSWFKNGKYSVHGASSPQWLHSVVFLHVHHTVQSVLRKAAPKFLFSFLYLVSILSFQVQIFIQDSTVAFSHFKPQQVCFWLRGQLPPQMLPPQPGDCCLSGRFKKEIMKDSAAQYSLITHAHIYAYKAKKQTKKMHQTGFQNQEHQGTASEITDLNRFLFITRTAYWHL